MLYQLNIEQRKILQMLPETGMGSQHVDIYFTDGFILKNIAVYNCSEFESDKKLDLNSIERIEIVKGF
jgi:hypothetical protein